MKLLLICLLMSTAIYAAGAGKIAGRVVDENGVALIGANIQIVETQQGVSAFNADGSFVILGIVPGAYHVRVTSIGYRTKLYACVVVAADSTTQLETVLREDFVSGYSPDFNDKAQLDSLLSSRRREARLIKAGKMRSYWHCVEERVAARYGKLEGCVTGSNCEALKKTFVRVVELKKKIKVTEPFGFWELPRVPQGIYTIEVAATGHRTEILDSVAVSLGNTKYIETRLSASQDGY